MPKQNWLNKQLDHAHTVVQSWSSWKRETIKSQIADVGGSSTSSNIQRSNQTEELEPRPLGRVRHA